MSELELHRTPASAAAAPAALPLVADAVIGGVKAGMRAVPVDVPLPGGRALPLTISRVKSLFGPKWRVLLDDNFPSCGSCRRSINRLSKNAEGLHSLLEILAEAVGIYSDCRYDGAGLVLPADLSRERPAGILVGSEFQRSRIKVLPLATDISSDFVAVDNLIKVGGPASSAAESHNAAQSAALAENAQPGGGEAVSQPAVLSVSYKPAPGAAVELTLPRHVCETIIKHCEQSNRNRREVGGLLVGYHYEAENVSPDLKHPCTAVTDVISIESADSSNVHMCWSEDIWSRLQEVFETRYASQNKVRLGWYHTHPDQRIFFSDKDKDFHTVFRQPYQFALVVDPRQMDAALFYWEDYERRSVSSTPTFKLVQREPLAEGGGSGEVITVQGVLSLWRVGTFSFAASLVVLCASSTVNRYRIDPNLACLLALLVLLWLKLWGSDYFHPKSVDELHLIRKVAKRLSGGLRGLRQRSPFGSTHGMKFFAASLLASALTLTTLYLTLTRPIPKPPASRAESPADARVTDDAPAALGGAATKTILYRKTPDGEIKVVLKSISPEMSLKYLRRFNGRNDEIWKASEAEEAAFFKSLFEWETRSTRPSSYIKRFQEDLFRGRHNIAASGADGVWGHKTRAAFLGRVEELANTERPMVIEASATKKVSLLFKREGP
jgi:proteasome lid subunit RPN8/RPN11